MSYEPTYQMLQMVNLHQDAHLYKI